MLKKILLFVTLPLWIIPFFFSWLFVNIGGNVLQSMFTSRNQERILYKTPTGMWRMKRRNRK